MDYEIVNAVPEDAPEIARAITVALHMGEIDAAIDCSPEELELWKKVFTNLAQRDDSQYSYRNTLKAVLSDGNSAGYIIGYDGADLHKLREVFFDEVEKTVGKSYRGIADETSPDEWYLDTLAVWPEYRCKGIGEKLLRAASIKGLINGKPIGLLVDKENHSGRRLYERVGFQNVGDRPFAGVIMDHMQLIQNLNIQ